MPWGPVWYSLCVYGPCRTPVYGQYAVGESELADIGRGRCSAAGVADLSALGHFRQRRPAGGTQNTHSGTGPALAAHPGVPLRRMRAGRHVARWAGRLEGGAIHEGLLSSPTVIIRHCGYQNQKWRVHVRLETVELGTKQRCRFGAPTSWSTCPACLGPSGV